MEQFNPSLRNFIAMGKNYEKALAGEAPRGPGWGAFRPGNELAGGVSPRALMSVPVMTGTERPAVWQEGGVWVPCAHGPRDGSGVSF